VTTTPLGGTPRLSSRWVPSPASLPPVPGQNIGRYRVVRFLGAGAMGEVHLARDPSLGRVVAIKLLKHDRGPAELETEARLLREAQALARLSHPHVVPVYDVGFHHGRFFVAMEYVRGQTLRQWLRGRRRGWSEILDVLIQAGRGLAAAHAAGLVHRDFKPDNVLVDRSGRARVMDFGLARTAGHVEVPSRDGADAGTDLATDLTRTGWVVGTPRYMSPEQHAGEPVDARSDQFAFCVTLFESLFGMRAFAGTDATAVSAAKRAGKVGNPVTGPRGDVARRVPRRIHEAILRGLRPDPAARWPTMDGLLHALEGARPRGRTVGRIGVLAGAVIVLVAVASSSESDPCASGAGRIDEIWSPETRAELGRTFRSSDATFAEDGFTATETAIDRWAEDWRAARHAACRGPHHADARLRCLDRGLPALETTLEVLLRGHATTLEHAVELAHALPSIEACARDEEGPAAPDDPVKRAALERTQQRLGEVQAYLTAGLLGAAEATARLAAREAEASGHPPAIATARGTLGDVLGRRGDPGGAARELAEAYWLAQESGQDETAARSATALAYWIGVTLARPDEGLAWARHAKAALERGPDRPLLRAQLLQNEALVLAAIGRVDEAIAEQDEAIALLSEHAPDRPLDLATAHASAADVLAGAGRHVEALQQRRRALTLREAVLGTNHPLLGESMLEVGFASRATGDGPEATRHMRRGLEILERAHGSDDARLVQPLARVGEALAEQALPSEAAPLLRRALALAQMVPDTPAADLVRARMRLARVELDLGHDARARELLGEAERTAVHAGDPELGLRVRALIDELEPDELDDRGASLGE
jgi:tetratricopeptide (TPR) repeat protein/predicted Ser/Thr protein kinase